MRKPERDSLGVFPNGLSPLFVTESLTDTHSCVSEAGWLAVLLFQDFRHALALYVTTGDQTQPVWPALC